MLVRKTIPRTLRSDGSELCARMVLPTPPTEKAQNKYKELWGVSQIRTRRLPSACPLPSSRSPPGRGVVASSSLGRRKLAMRRRRAAKGKGKARGTMTCERERWAAATRGLVQAWRRRREEGRKAESAGARGSAGSGSVAPVLPKRVFHGQESCEAGLRGDFDDASGRPRLVVRFLGKRAREERAAFDASESGGAMALTRPPKRVFVSKKALAWAASAPADGPGAVAVGKRTAAVGPTSAAVCRKPGGAGLAFGRIRAAARKVVAEVKKVAIVKKVNPSVLARSHIRPVLDTDKPFRPALAAGIWFQDGKAVLPVSIPPSALRSSWDAAAVLVPALPVPIVATRTPLGLHARVYGKTLASGDALQSGFLDGEWRSWRAALELVFVAMSPKAETTYPDLLAMLRSWERDCAKPGVQPVVLIKDSSRQPARGRWHRSVPVRLVVVPEELSWWQKDGKVNFKAGSARPMLGPQFVSSFGILRGGGGGGHGG